MPQPCAKIPDAAARRRYRIAKSTLALFKEDEGFVARPISEGSVIAFDPVSVAKGVLIEVLWQDKLVLMFAADLKSMAVPDV
jgi:hypothetical protein